MASVLLGQDAEERDMYIYAQAFRTKSSDDAEQICRLIRQNLSLTQEPGHYQTGCYAEINDRRALHVFSQWTSLEALHLWISSPAHQQIHEQFQTLINGPEHLPTVYEEVW